MIHFNSFDDKIELINKRIEDLDNENNIIVDTLISEPLGLLLVNERMLESYLQARDK